ncbi:MAG TPA: hypothetical protein EYP10_06950, partial [Armatimonadetes bacterium]|nr:hypothetical protein [Armatimonadota bacterium]
VVMVCGYFPQRKQVAIEVVRLRDDDVKPLNVRRAGFPMDERKRRVVKPLRVTETAIMFELPDMGGLGIYAFAIRINGKIACASMVNHPEIWWALGDVVASKAPFGAWRLEHPMCHRNGELRIFGRCLKLGKRTPTVCLRSHDGKMIYLRPSMADEWSLVVRIPKSIAHGRYEIWMHNGYGGRNGWSGPLPLAIVPREREPQTVIDVTKFGANGDDVADDTDALKAALDEAKRRGGAIVVLPRGRLFITEAIEIPPHVTLRGAGRELTAICIPDVDEPPSAWFIGAHHFAIEDLTIYCSNHQHVIASDMSGDAKRSGYARIERIRIRADAYRGHLKPRQIDLRFRASLRLSTGGGDTIRLGGPCIRIVDCDVYGSGRSLYLRRVVGGVVSNNVLYNGR